MSKLKFPKSAIKKMMKVSSAGNSNSVISQMKFGRSCVKTEAKIEQRAECLQKASAKPTL